MSENILPTSSQPRTAIREIQPATAQAELGQVEEVNSKNSNTPAVFQRAATSILGRPNIGAAARTTPIFGRGSHAGFVQGQRNALAQFTAPINQAQVEALGSFRRVCS
jgi:hypothetical protein